MKHGRTIKLFLADGSPTGLIIAEIPNWSGMVLSFPRTKLPEVLKSRAEVNKTGFYFLIGPDPENAFRSTVYVGETEDVRTRFKEHEKKKDFFEHILLVVSKDDNLTKSHIRYLESRAIESIKSLASAALDNANKGQPVNLPESDVSDMEYFFQQIRMIFPVLSQNFFQEVPHFEQDMDNTEPLSQNRVLFELSLNNSEVTAEAYEESGQFVVKAGSICRHPDEFTKAFLNDSFGYIINDVRESKANCLLIQDSSLSSKVLRLVRDKPFSSPSSAAMFVCGSSKNGRTYWKVKGTGQTYADWREQQMASTDNESVLAK